MEPIDAIHGELDRLEAALGHRPLPAARVAEHLRRLDRIRTLLLVKLDPLLREACLHDGVVTEDGACFGCGQEGIPSRTSLIPLPPKLPSIPGPADPSSAP